MLAETTGSTHLPAPSLHLSTQCRYTPSKEIKQRHANKWFVKVNRKLPLSPWNSSSRWWSFVKNILKRTQELYRGQLHTADTFVSISKRLAVKGKSIRKLHQHSQNLRKVSKNHLHFIQWASGSASWRTSEVLLSALLMFLEHKAVLISYNNLILHCSPQEEEGGRFMCNNSPGGRGQSEFRARS